MSEDMYELTVTKFTDKLNESITQDILNLYEITIMPAQDEKSDLLPYYIIGTKKYKFGVRVPWDGKSTITTIHHIICSENELKASGHKLGPNDVIKATLDWKGNIKHLTGVELEVYCQYKANDIIDCKEGELPKCVARHSQQHIKCLVPIDLDMITYHTSMMILPHHQYCMMKDGKQLHRFSPNKIGSFVEDLSTTQMDEILNGLISGCVTICKINMYEIDVFTRYR